METHTERKKKFIEIHREREREREKERCATIRGKMEQLVSKEKTNENK